MRYNAYYMMREIRKERHPTGVIVENTVIWCAPHPSSPIDAPTAEKALRLAQDSTPYNLKPLVAVEPRAYAPR